MARWKRIKTASFSDMPEELQQSKAEESDELTQRRHAWIEANGLSLVDFFTWWRAKYRPQQFPAKRSGALPPEVAAEVAKAEALERERLVAMTAE